MVLDTSENILPTQSWLRPIADEIRRTQWAAEIYDLDWKLLWVSDELKRILGHGSDIGVGEHILDLYQREEWKTLTTSESSDDFVKSLLPRASRGVDIDGVERDLGASSIWGVEIVLNLDTPTRARCLTVPVVDGSQVGHARLYGPGLRASVLSVVAQGDTQQFELMSRLAIPGPRQTAILFADLESSTRISRKLSSEANFEFIVSLMQAMDEVVLSHGGLVGKHTGDGISAFFIADEHPGYSGAVRAAMVAAASIQEAVGRLADQNPLLADLDLKANAGLHCGSTYIGQISTGGRLEVTAIGDEVNDTARIEESASGGEILVSKHLLEQLDSKDAKYLGLDVSRQMYSPLSGRAGEKAARDGVDIPVTSYRPT